jgi:hypothetical protein
MLTDNHLGSDARRPRLVTWARPIGLGLLVPVAYVLRILFVVVPIRVLDEFVELLLAHTERLRPLQQRIKKTDELAIAVEAGTLPRGRPPELHDLANTEDGSTR